MDKSKYYKGQVYRISPTPKHRANNEAQQDAFSVIEKTNKALLLAHVATGIQWQLYWDSIQEFREPDFLLIKGQVWLNDAIVEFEPGFDHRKIAAMASTVGLRVYRVANQKAQSADALHEEKEILQIIGSRVTKEGISKLRKMLPVARTKSNELQILLALVAWHQEAVGTERGMELTNRGIKLAAELDMPREKAVFHSYRSVFLTWKWAEIDLNGWGSVQASNLTGFPFLSTEEQNNIVQSLRKLDSEINENILESFRVCKQTADLKLIGLTYSNAIIVQGLKAMHLRGLSVPEWSKNKDILKRIFSDGKDGLLKFGDQESLGYLYHNTANQLRFLGELEEAEGLATEANRIGGAIKDMHLENISKQLLGRIAEMRT